MQKELKRRSEPKNNSEKLGIYGVRLPQSLLFISVTQIHGWIGEQKDQQQLASCEACAVGDHPFLHSPKYIWLLLTLFCSPQECLTRSARVSSHMSSSHLF
jgi:hypothetical protein